jgi:hypothetical protein
LAGFRHIAGVMPPHRRRLRLLLEIGSRTHAFTAPIRARWTICVKSALKSISSVDNAMTYA